MKKNILHINTFKKATLIFLAISSLYVAQALTISPARLELSADPGVSISSEFTIVNEQDADQTYYTSVENFEAQGESGTPNFTQSKEGFPSWVEVTSQVTLKKGEKVKIPFTVHVPNTADAGGHFAAIFLSTIPPTTGAGEVSVGAKVGMLMLLKVNGDIKENGGIMSFFLKQGTRVVTSLPVDFVYRFSNDGSDRVKPLGNVTIKNMFGMVSAKINANSTEGNILPKSIRRFDAKWGDAEPLPASAPFMSHVQYQLQNFALGFYSANLDLTFGSKTANSSLYFFVIPWHLLVVVFTIVVICILVLRFALSRHNKFIIAQARMMSEGNSIEKSPKESKKKSNAKTESQKKK